MAVEEGLPAPPPTESVAVPEEVPVLAVRDTVIFPGALLPITNPFSTAPLFASLTANFDKPKQRQQAFLACVYAFFILVVFFVPGGLTRIGQVGVRLDRILRKPAVQEEVS